MAVDGIIFASEIYCPCAFRRGGVALRDVI